MKFSNQYVKLNRNACKILGDDFKMLLPEYHCLFDTVLAKIDSNAFCRSPDGRVGSYYIAEGKTTFMKHLGFK